MGTGTCDSNLRRQRNEDFCEFIASMVYLEFPTKHSCVATWEDSDSRVNKKKINK